MRDAVLTLIKRLGPLSPQAIAVQCDLSPTTVRHHLKRLWREGLIEPVPAGRSGAGRPATMFAATARAEGHFPKRYVELLRVVLQEAESSLVIATLFEGVVTRLAEPLRERLRRAVPERRLRAMLDSIDYGQMLASLEPIRWRARTACRELPL